jgi:curved DNA-binding protein CbpA
MSNKLIKDFYELLQISPTADSETIEKIYRILAKRYHPDNTISGDINKFTEITTAYKTLRDPEKRAEYDVKYASFNEQQWNSITRTFSPDGHDNDKEIRRIILTILYLQRRDSPSDPGVGPWYLEKMMEWPEEVLTFHLWYLKEKKWILRNDSGAYAITADGVDELESYGTAIGRDRLLTQITQSTEDDDGTRLIDTHPPEILSSPKKPLKAESKTITP